MLESYERPIDRPSTVWCGVCNAVNTTKFTSISKENIPTPMNLRRFQHTCGALGSLKFRYTGEISEPIPTSNGWCNATVVKPTPHCGNIGCDGSCLDPLCVPPPPTPPSNSKSLWAFCAGAIVGTGAGALISFFLKA